MELSRTYKILIGFVAVALVGYAVYSLVVSTPDTTTVTDGSGNVIVGKDIVDLVEKLKTVVVDPSVFSDNLFQNLKDFPVFVPSESQGRNNPFAPIGTDGNFVGVTFNIGTTSGVKK